MSTATCPNCAAQIRIPADYPTRTAKCPQCHTRFTIDSPDDTSDEPMERSEMPVTHASSPPTVGVKEPAFLRQAKNVGAIVVTAAIVIAVMTMVLFLGECTMHDLPAGEIVYRFVSNALVASAVLLVGYSFQSVLLLLIDIAKSLRRMNAGQA